MRAAVFFLLALCACAPTQPVGSPTEAEAESTTGGAVEEGEATASEADIEIGQIDAAAPEEEMAEARPVGLASLFRARPREPVNEAAAQTDAAAQDAPATDEPAKDDAEDKVAEPVAPEASQPASGSGGFLGGLFAGGGGGTAAASKDLVAPGTLLPFGEVAKICSATKRDMGDAVDRRGGWMLYDTDPSTVAQRVMYITGFKDKCARMFSASLVLFGSALAHETVRYTKRGAYSETDEAYEAIKAKVCGVKRGAPCPADRIDRLETKMSFVTVYPGFGAGSGPWLELLLHDGKLEAVAVTKR